MKKLTIVLTPPKGGAAGVTRGRVVVKESMFTTIEIDPDYWAFEETLMHELGHAFNENFDSCTIESEKFASAFSGIFCSGGGVDAIRHDPRFWSRKDDWDYLRGKKHNLSWREIYKLAEKQVDRYAELLLEINEAVMRNKKRGAVILIYLKKGRKAGIPLTIDRISVTE